ncbi:MAG: hypothetical protein QG673_377 [Pseudomonadota bacterium]|nr:hypothetical protein [Pseudomonadota bacterium]
MDNTRRVLVAHNKIISRVIDGEFNKVVNKVIAGIIKKVIGSHNSYLIVLHLFVINDLFAVNNNVVAISSSTAPSSFVSLSKESLSNAQFESEVKRVESQMGGKIYMTNLANADTDANDLIKLKRQLEIEKAQADIKKLHNPTSTVKYNNLNEYNNSSGDWGNMQTTVTGVAINHGGKKIAWLQFADGGSLTVNVGSRVGKYMVNNITMEGIQLSYYSGKGKSKLQNLFLNRIYSALEKPKTQQNQRISPVFTPSPIVTSANIGVAGKDAIPPIVSMH